MFKLRCFLNEGYILDLDLGSNDRTPACNKT